MTEIPTSRRTSLYTRFTGHRTAMRESGLFRWWWIVVLGIVSMLLGAGVLGRPGAALQVTAALAGIWLVVTGLRRVFTAFLSAGRWRVLSGAVGVLLLTVGAAGLRDLAMMLALIAVVVAVAWLVSGINATAMAVKASGGMRLLLAAAGLVSTTFGLVFLLEPRLSLYTLVVTTGLGFVLTGAIQVVVGIGFRHDDGS